MLASGKQVWIPVNRRSANVTSEHLMAEGFRKRFLGTFRGRVIAANKIRWTPMASPMTSGPQC